MRTPWTARALVAPVGYQPLTERIAAAIGSRAWATLLFAALPFVHLAAFYVAARGAGITSAPPESLVEQLPQRVMNAYLIVIGFVASPLIVRRLARTLAWSPEGRDEGATWWSWLLPPLVLSLVGTIANEAGHALEFGIDVIAATPGPFVVSAVLAFLIRVPQLTALWTAVVALLAVARLGRTGVLGSFPEDRSLGLAPVGETVFQLFLLVVVAFIPVFLLSGRVTDLALNTALFAMAIYALVLAVWHLHRRMAAARHDAVAAARARYAAAYRVAEAELGSPGAATALQTAEILLRGAEGIHEWPFDERTQRIVALVMTGVTTGLIVRLILYAFGI